MKRLAKRLALAMCSALLTILVAEGAFRVYHFGWAALIPKQMASVHPLGQSGLLRATDFDRPRYELKPDVRSHFKMRAFDTNSFGMRDREYTLEKPAGTFRIAFVGDSWTMGSGVAIENVFHSVIESELNGRSEAIRYECLNFGVGGYGLWDYAGVIDAKARAFDADLVVVCLSGNDKVPERREQPEFREKPARNYFWTVVLWEYARRLSLASDDPLPAPKPEQKRKPRQKLQQKPRPGPDSAPEGAGDVSSREPGDPPRRRPTPNLRDREMTHIRDGVTEIRRACAELQRPVVVVNLSGIYAKGTAVSRFIGGVCEDFGLPYYTVRSAFEGIDTDRFWIFRDDKHPNAEANAILAETVLAHLRDASLLPE